MKMTKLQGSVLCELGIFIPSIHASSSSLHKATMATEAPDPRTFKSWEDAFQYPIPVVRKVEQQLRSNAGENREKLRSLVG